MATSTTNPSTKEGRQGEGRQDESRQGQTHQGQGHQGQGHQGEGRQDAAHQGADMLEKVKEAGAEVLDKAKGAVTSVGGMTADSVSAAGKKADDLTAAAGHEIKEFGETLAKKAPHEGMAGQAAQAVADTIKGSGRYIEEHKLSGMARDVEHVVKEHPFPALLICFGIGFCLGRAMKA